MAAEDLKGAIEYLYYIIVGDEYTKEGGILSADDKGRFRRVNSPKIETLTSQGLNHAVQIEYKGITELGEGTTCRRPTIHAFEVHIGYFVGDCPGDSAIYIAIDDKTMVKCINELGELPTGVQGYIADTSRVTELDDQRRLLTIQVLIQVR